MHSAEESPGEMFKTGIPGPTLRDFLSKVGLKNSELLVWCPHLRAGNRTLMNDYRCVVHLLILQWQTL